MRIGILTGTGFTTQLTRAEELDVDTPWGGITTFHERTGDLDLFFVNRHGRDVRPPHRISHRANVEALARCKVDAILAINAVGALDPMLEVPSLLVPDDLLDMRRSTETFHDARATHVDMTEAYCPHLRALLVRHARATDGGIYAAVDGPRLETRAEVRMLRAMGGAVVGMTGCPEAALARERALCYASLCLVVNRAAGLGDGPLAAEAIRAGATALAPRAWDAVLAAARGVDATRRCACRAALEGARL